jgi:tetratricopeptide (TPR) repeat protein
MKFKLTIFLFILSLNALGQAATVQSAANSYKKNELAEGKKLIDEAAAFESTSNDPKMWYYRGMIYLAISSNPEKRSLDADAAEKSAISFMNCLKTDRKENYKDDCMNSVWDAGIRAFNDAVDAYTKKDFAKAERLYNLIFEVIPLDKDNNLKRSNITPDILNKNLYAVAKQTKDNAKAKTYLQKLIDARFNDPLIYIYMERIYLEEKDTANALKYVEMGRNIFDDNSALINEELAIYIARGNTEVLIAKLSDAIDKTPDNEVLYFIRGNLYSNRKETEKCVGDYKKAIELKPEYFDANYNLGAMYFNDGAEIANAANKLPMSATKEYEAAQKKFKEKMGQAQPFLEAALEANPKDGNTILTLKELYAKTNQLEKSAEMKKRYEELGQK